MKMKTRVPNEGGLPEETYMGVSFGHLQHEPNPSSKPSPSNQSPFMSGVNRHGMRADQFMVDNDGMFRPDGTPILIDCPKGEVIEKVVDYYTMECPECGTEGRYRERSEVICDNDECGVVLSDKPIMVMEDYSEKTHNGVETMGNSIGNGPRTSPGLQD